jgi:hypothetical protein
MNREMMEAALESFNETLRRTQGYIALLRSQLDGGRGGQRAQNAHTPGGRRPISNAGRKRIAEATRARWEAWRKAKEAGHTPVAHGKTAKKPARRATT